MKVLSVLICSLPEPHYTQKLGRLMDVLTPQVSDNVEVIVDDGGRGTPTGTKRNNLIGRASGDYIVFVDSDDLVADSYISDILYGLQGSPDCVTFRGWMTTNGGARRDWTIRLGSDYVERDGHFYRWPNHISVMKKSLVKDIQFPALWQQEDYIWSKMIHDRKILKTEHHIDKQLYHYDYWDNKNKKPNAEVEKLVRRSRLR